MVVCWSEYIGKLRKLLPTLIELAGIILIKPRRTAKIVHFRSMFCGEFSISTNQVASVLTLTPTRCNLEIIMDEKLISVI